ncbi:MAG: ATPase [Gammaproteobacteria bacterium]|nr:ATPase [Gammaproteobacteria bacterium]
MDENKTSLSAGNGEIEATLTRLLKAEEQAEAIVQAASDECKKAVDEALEGVRQAEQKLESALDELRAPFLQEAEALAAQEIAELTRKYDERQRRLRKLGETHLEEALRAAEAIMLDPSR